MEYFKGPNLERTNQWQELWGYLVKAVELSDAAKALNETYPQHLFPQYLLLGQSIEVALKSYLIFKGTKKKELKDPKKFGHDLQKLIIECKGHGLNIENDTSEIIETLRDAYYSHFFRYGFEGKNSGPSMPVMDDLLITTDDLIRTITNSIPSSNSDQLY